MSQEGDGESGEPPAHRRQAGRLSAEVCLKSPRSASYREAVSRKPQITLPPLHGADSALEISGDFFPGIENVSIGDNFIIHESRTSHAHDSIAREGLAADTNQGTILGNMRGSRNTDIP